MDIRLKQLSYSSSLTLHLCPRKYQIYKLSNKPEAGDLGEDSESVTYAFGHALGEGIQSVLIGDSEDVTIWKMFLAWDAGLFADNEKQNKSFWLAIAAVQRFIALRANGFLKGWKLYYHQGKPAVELSFIITLPDDFKYRGMVDAVLIHEVTGEVMVLEVKSSSASYLPPAQFKNSAQAIGYSIVLDVLFPDLSSYKVQYLPYLTKAEKYEPMDFTKDYFQRALWIKELLLDIECIKMYDSESVFPMHGESCYAWWRDCEYLTLCTMSTERLMQPLDDTVIEKLEASNSKYEIKLTLQDLIDAQIRKIS